MRRAPRRLGQRTNDGAAGEVDLEGIVLEAFGVPQQLVRGAREGRLPGGLPASSANSKNSQKLAFSFSGHHSACGSRHWLLAERW